MQDTASKSSHQLSLLIHTPCSRSWGPPCAASSESEQQLRAGSSRLHKLHTGTPLEKHIPVQKRKCPSRKAHLCPERKHLGGCRQEQSCCSRGPQGQVRDSKSFWQLRTRLRKEFVHIYRKTTPACAEEFRQGGGKQSTIFPSPIPQHCPGTQDELQQRSASINREQLCSPIPSESIIQFAWQVAVPRALQCYSSK